jgi:Uma2 family endonuclease
MSVVQEETIEQIEYPESDGKPMAETDVHRDWMWRILDILRQRYRGQQVYVASNLFIYYGEGNPSKSVAPDEFVVKDCDPRPRRTFQIWNEGGKVPDMVIEVTSRSTRREDRSDKPEIYRLLGVKEYFLFDPTAEYLRPPLQGYRLEHGDFTKVEPDESGVLRCEELDITLRLEGRDLVLCDGTTGQVLPTEAEAAEAGRRAERAARRRAVAARKQAEADREQAEADREQAQAERKRAEAARKQAEAARVAAETRAAELEAEVQRLREELKRKSREK